MNEPENTQYNRIKQLEAEGVDVLILGAGVNGAGLFRDLSEQGVNCLIVDKADFGSGTSAAPSRLIHGGLKYLETGEFGLIAQSTLERNLLLKNAPHNVQPLPTFIPVFSWTRGVWASLRTLMGSTTAPRSRGAVLIKIGLALYDYFGARERVMPRHRFLFKNTATKEMPYITPAIVAGGIYHDAKVSQPERLVYELVSDGLAANPKSAASNFMALVSAKDGAVSFEGPDGAAFTVTPKLVVNAAGPWIDHVNEALGKPTKMIGGTKGSHILIDHPELVKSLNGRMIYFEADDGRICLVYDYHGLALVGSTDIPSDDPDNVRAEEPEIDYFIDSLRSLLPKLQFDRKQIVYAYSGIRPLPASNASEPGLISRDHSAPIIEPDRERPFAIISLVGGKWTTFRGFAEEVADTVLSRLGRDRLKSTRNLSIGGGKDYPAGVQAHAAWVGKYAMESGLSSARVETLLARYGTTASAIIEQETRVGTVFLPETDTISAAEIAWIARNELVVHLADIVLRRTTLAIDGALSTSNLQAIADIAARELGWSDARKMQEIETVTTELARRHGVILISQPAKRR
ncbi:glycerol-3-phosphate dehydrogenase/oxidase [Falsochrobactrum sp. TDYN1]|uniref:Glycerol-3-phosphate dehydrogenase/oxidase n=1 Tax=Falsochrobactrum tianjinense TaxID=2706015 RepID=A0A949UU63_9HYPH|nr:glycerol-3-phosphate dehydrogenase/oxidase [Falsochrobactrum sp. TDYN1]MBV2143056.1 glycerol-3-phosphate dehydrogenase/oxidase [Falsochrobactrum sp. TDYN1]